MVPKHMEIVFCFVRQLGRVTGRKVGLLEFFWKVPGLPRRCPAEKPAETAEKLPSREPAEKAKPKSHQTSRKLPKTSRQATKNQPESHKNSRKPTNNQPKGCQKPAEPQKFPTHTYPEVPRTSSEVARPPQRQPLSLWEA